MPACGYVPPDSPAQFGLMGFMKCYLEQKIDNLDARKRCAWGIPAPRIDCSFGNNDSL